MIQTDLLTKAQAVHRLCLGRVLAEGIPCMASNANAKKEEEEEDGSGSDADMLLSDEDSADSSDSKVKRHTLNL